MAFFHSNTQKLNLEAFKVESMFQIFNNCADSCKMQYHESGITNGALEDVACFKNCLGKAHKMETALFR